MKKGIYLHLTLTLTVCVNAVFAQVTFQNFANQWNIQHSMTNTDFWGAGISVFDIDNDGWDDITFLQENDSLKIYKNNLGEFQLLPSVIATPGRVKSSVWGDLDNDGDNDLLLSTYNGPFKVYECLGDCQFEEIQLPYEINTLNLFNYGVTLADYNSDGLLDIYLARYVFSGDPTNVSQTNMLLRNNGEMDFSDVTFSAGVDDGIGLSFMGIWIDVNKDFLPDLYVINDRIQSNNSLYINNGDETFTDISSTSGALLIGDDPMSATFGDFDNDGDLDIFCSNSGDQNKLARLLMNNGNTTFSEVAEQYAVNLDKLSWGSTWIDADNDGFLDLYVTTGSGDPNNEFISSFYRNNSGEGFTDYSTVFSGNSAAPSFAVAKGDLDMNGFEDMVVLNTNGTNSFIWKNTSFNQTNGRFIRMKLSGQISNKMAIGSWIEVYSEGFQISYYSRCGENYLSQNSGYVHFGLGSADIVDSVVIRYPSGIIDRYYGLEVNSTYSFIEGETYQNQIVLLGDPIMCDGESLILDAGEFNTYLWSNGETTRFIETSISGEYHVVVTNQFGLNIVSDTVSVVVFSPPVFDPILSHIFCDDESGFIDLNPLLNTQQYSIMWNDGQNGTLIQVDEPGIYSFDYIDIAGCQVSESFEIFEEVPLSLVYETEYNEQFSDFTIYVEAIGGTPPVSLYLNSEPITPFVFGLQTGEYLVSAIDVKGCSDSVLIILDHNGIINILKNPLKIWPNPVNDYFTISSSFSDIISYELLSLNGKKLEYDLNCAENNCSTIDLPQGVYFLKVSVSLAESYYCRLVKL